MVWIYSLKTEEKRPLGNLGINRRIILKWILRKWVTAWVCTSCGSEHGPVAVSCVRPK
jgi:hypothetical protein